MEALITPVLKSFILQCSFQLQRTNTQTKCSGIYIETNFVNKDRTHNSMVFDVRTGETQTPHILSVKMTGMTAKVAAKL